MLLMSTQIDLETNILVQTGADPGFDSGGGPDRDRPKLPMVRSSVM